MNNQSLLPRITDKPYRNFWMGIAIIFVVIYHIFGFRIRTEYPDFIALFFTEKLDIGVNIFFFLSAYGLCHSYTKNTLAIYYRNRFLRLFPIYPVFFIIGAKWIFQYNMGNKIIYAFYQFTGLAMFFHNSMEWFIPALILLYVLFPILYKIVKVGHNVNFLFPNFLCLLVVMTNYLYPTWAFSLFTNRIPIMIIGIYTFIATTKKELAINYLIFCGLSLLMLDKNYFFFLPIMLLIFNEYISDLVPNKIVSFCGKHSLEIYLGQCYGLQQFYSHCDGNIVICIINGLCITVISSILLNLVQSSFLKLTKARTK